MKIDRYRDRYRCIKREEIEWEAEGIVTEGPIYGRGIKEREGIEEKKEVGRDGRERGDMVREK